MVLLAASPASYLGSNEFIESTRPEIVGLAAELRVGRHVDADFAEAAFHWVRDQVSHSYDVQDPRVTVTSSEVLDERVGLCYAKAHLLAALLRAEGIPTGLCYQRLADDGIGSGHVVHGLIALHLDGAWHRQDPRGNRPGVDAQFSLREERLAWSADPARGEIDYPRIYEAPVESVISALRSTDDALTLYRSGLPHSLTDDEAAALRVAA